MIVVKVELWPFGSKNFAREIGRMTITNDGTGTKSKGNYKIRVMRRGTEDRVQRSVDVKDHSRLSKPVWNLVRKALESAGF